MYAEYAKDPRMKINVGIRRRLAPLLDNGRDEIELMHAILFSLPGSPGPLLRRRDRDGRQRLPRRPRRRAHADAVDGRPQRRLLARRLRPALRAAADGPGLRLPGGQRRGAAAHADLAAALDAALHRAAQGAPGVRPRHLRAARRRRTRGSSPTSAATRTTSCCACTTWRARRRRSSSTSPTTRAATRSSCSAARASRASASCRTCSRSRRAASSGSSSRAGEEERTSDDRREPSPRRPARTLDDGACATGSSSSAGSRSKAREVAHVDVLEAVTLRDETAAARARARRGALPDRDARALPGAARRAARRRGLAGARDRRGRRLDRLRRARRPGARPRAAAPMRATGDVQAERRARRRSTGRTATAAWPRTRRCARWASSSPTRRSSSATRWC